MPTQVGECERGTLGVGLEQQRVLARWDHKGQIQDPAAAEQAWLATLAGAYRLNRQWQVGASLPTRMNQIAPLENPYWGGGVGDAQLSVLWAALFFGVHAMPLFSLALRLPTGRSTEEASGLLMEDVTGLQGPAALLGTTLDRSTSRVPRTLGIQGEASQRPALSTSGSVGWYLNSAWTLSLRASHLRRWTPSPSGTWGRSSTTDASFRLITGTPVAWRAWVQVGAGVPLDAARH